MAATSIVRRIEGMMSPGKSLEAAALAFPGKVERALAAIDEEPEARELMGKADALSRYAKRIKVDTDTLNHIQHGRLLVGAKLGELMPRQKPPGKKIPTDGVGIFNPNTTSCLRKLNDNRERIGQYIAEAIASDEPEETSMAGFIRYAAGDPHVSQNSGENEWYTPAEYIEAARDVMGGIDLDPASTAAANEIVKAKRFYSIADDGLKKKWKGRVWLNPPYAMPLVFDFCVKFATHVEDEDVPEGIVLVNNATETRWFAQLADVASAVAFPTGRVKFWSQTRTTATPLQGQAILYAGKNRTRFIDEFGQFGWVAKRLFPIEGACCRHRNNKP